MQTEHICSLHNLEWFSFCLRSGQLLIPLCCAFSILNNNAFLQHPLCTLQVGWQKHPFVQMPDGALAQCITTAALHAGNFLMEVIGSNLNG